MDMKTEGVFMIDQTIQQLLNETIHRAIIDPMDEIYVRNQILSLLNLDDFQVQDPAKLPKDIPVDPDLIIPELLEEIVQYAVEHGIVENYLDAKEIFSAKIMNCFLESPSVVNQRFYEKYENSPVAATDYFYQLSKSSNYIQLNRIKKILYSKLRLNMGIWILQSICLSRKRIRSKLPKSGWLRKKAGTLNVYYVLKMKGTQDESGIRQGRITV